MRAGGRSGAGAADGAADVQVEGVAVAVVAEERVRHVHAAVGLDRDQAVVAVVDELLALGLLAELLEQPLRDVCSIQIRPSSSWLTVRSKTSAEYVPTYRLASMRCGSAGGTGSAGSGCR